MLQRLIIKLGIQFRISTVAPRRELNGKKEKPEENALRVLPDKADRRRTRMCAEVGSRVGKTSE